jgi:lysophospholipase L1-like esterase
MYKGYTYLAMGDSITWSQTTPGSGLYASRLFRAICKDYGNIHYLNKGFGGADSTETVGNMGWLATLNPDLVTIGLGMNDAFNTTVTVAQYQTNLRTLIDTWKRRNSNVSIILCAPSQTTDAARSTIQQYRDAMKSVATEKNVSFCDFGLAFTQAQVPTYCGADGVHPNDSGHLLLFNLLYPIVKQTDFITKFGSH